MLIDSGHRRWIIATIIIGAVAFGFYFIEYRAAPDGLTGGSRVGLVYGIAGSLLMIFAGSLSAHRRLARLRWLPRRSWLLKGHIWFGLLSVLLIWCHSGFRWGGTLETILWFVLILITLSGILGLILQNTIPRLLRSQVTEETPYEQMPHVCRLILQRADGIVDDLCGSNELPLDANVQSELRDYYENEIRPYLQNPGAATQAQQVMTRPEDAFARLVSIPALTGVHDRLHQLQGLCIQRRDIVYQERLHHWLHLWLLVHIPLSVALLVLGLAHAVIAVYY